MSRCYTCLHNYKCVSDEPRCNEMCDGKDACFTLSNYEFMKRMDEEEMAAFLHSQDFSEKDPREILDWLYTNAQYVKEDVKDYKFWFG